LSSLYAQQSNIEGIPIFVDEPSIVSSSMIEEELSYQDREDILLDKSEKVESKIIDDVHDIPTVITLKSYQGEKGREKQEISTSSMKIIKYINPQMYQVNLSQPEVKVDFWKLLDEAMQKSATLLLKRHDINITKANLAIIKSEYYPSLSLTYFNEYYHGFSRSSSANIGGSVYPANSEFRNSLNLNIDYEVYRFGASDLRMSMGGTDIDILKSEIVLEKERIAKELLQNYTLALKAQEIIKTKKKMLFVKNTLLDNTQRLYDAGFASRTDIARLRIDEVGIEKEILRAKLQILEAMKNIHILANVNINTEEIGLAMLEPSKDVMVKAFAETALSHNLKLQIDKKLEEIELIKKEYYPTLYAKGAYQLYGADRNHDFDAIGELERNNWNIGIMLKWDIFNGFKTNNTIEKAKLEVEKLLEQYRQEKITYEAREEKRVLLREMIQKILSEEGVLLNETGIQKELLTRLQEAGNISILEVDKIEISRLQSELDFKLEVIDQVQEDILSQLTM
jgi:outer membrane protein TolC